MLKHSKGASAMHTIGVQIVVESTSWQRKYGIFPKVSMAVQITDIFRFHHIIIQCVSLSFHDTVTAFSFRVVTRHELWLFEGLGMRSGLTSVGLGPRWLSPHHHQIIGFFLFKKNIFIDCLYWFLVQSLCRLLWLVSCNVFLSPSSAKVLGRLSLPWPLHSLAIAIGHCH